MRAQHVKSGHGFVVVFSVQDKDTYDEIPSFFELIEDVKNKSNSPAVLCGNKW